MTTTPAKTSPRLGIRVSERELQAISAAALNAAAVRNDWVRQVLAAAVIANTKPPRLLGAEPINVTGRRGRPTLAYTDQRRVTLRPVIDSLDKLNAAAAAAGMAPATWARCVLLAAASMTQAPL